jgi:hypothetical protein
LEAQRLGYILDDRGIGVRVLARIQDFYLLHNFQTGFGAQQASYSMGACALPPKVEWMMSEADHSFPNSAQIMNAWSYTPTVLGDSMGWCLTTIIGTYFSLLQITH